CEHPRQLLVAIGVSVLDAATQPVGVGLHAAGRAVADVLVLESLRLGCHGSSRVKRWVQDRRPWPQGRCGGPAVMREHLVASLPQRLAEVSGCGRWIMPP